MFYINLNVEDIVRMNEQLRPAAEAALAKAAAELSSMGHAHAIEQANSKLHSTRDLFIQNLSFEQVNDKTWVIALAGKYAWVDDGMCVVHNGNRKTTAKILTSSGWISILDIKVGDLVLNQYGKWTKVLTVHNNDLFDFCRENIDVEETIKTFGYDPNQLTKASHKKVIVRCRTCLNTKSIKYQYIYNHNNTICTVCANEIDIISIKTKKAISFMGKEKTLVLTANHLIFTSRGWIRVADLNKNDHLYIPYWGKCQNCISKVPFGNSKFCSRNCSVSYNNKLSLQNGTHVSQRPNFISDIYKKSIGNGKKISKAEHLFAKSLERNNNKVIFYSKENNLDFNNNIWIRQYPIKLENNNKTKYLFLDFYNPYFKTIIEIDGEPYHSTKDQQLKDMERDKILKTMGLNTIRIPARETSAKYKVDKIVQSILSILSNHSNDIEFKPIKIMTIKRNCKYKNGFSWSKRWDITVEEGDSFVCNNVLIHNSSFDMLPGFLSSPKAKTGKEGGRYLIIPFKHNIPPTRQTQAQQSLTATLRQEMKQRGIPFGKIERGPDGRPLTGLLHKFDITHSPIKTRHGPGMGKGPIGAVTQGLTGTPFLQRVGVYQKEIEVQKGQKSVQRGIFTFRTASSKQSGKDIWKHPGFEAKHIFESTYEWILQQWTQEIKNRVIQDLLQNL